MKVRTIAAISSLAFLFAVSFAPSVFAFTLSFGITPTNIAPDQSTQVTVTVTGATIHSMVVTGPDGTNYTSTTCTSGTTCTQDFGTGLTGWQITYAGTGCSGFTPALNGPSNSHCTGDYVVAVNGVQSAPANNKFSVIGSFAVPEFALPTAVVAAGGFLALLLVKGRFASKPKLA